MVVFDIGELHFVDGDLGACKIALNERQTGMNQICICFSLSNSDFDLDFGQRHPWPVERRLLGVTRDFSIFGRFTAGCRFLLKTWANQRFESPIHAHA